MATQNPTKTAGISRRWQAEATRRYRLLSRRIVALLATGEEGTIAVPAIDPQTLAVANAFEYTSDPRKVAQFMAWLQKQIDATVIGNGATPGDNWQNSYVDEAYLRGADRMRAELQRAGVSAVDLVGLTAAEITGSAQVVLGASVRGPIHLDAISTLYVRDFAALKGVTEEMSKQIGRVLVEGIEQGLGARDIAKAVNDRVNRIGVTRSRLIARTETVRAYNVGTIAEFEDVSARLDSEPQFKWLTAGDDRVRDDHVERDGKIYDAATARRLIGEPNCRCALRPHFDERLTT